MAETCSVVGCPDHLECDSAGSVSRLGRGTRLRTRLRSPAPAGGLRLRKQLRGPPNLKNGPVADAEDGSAAVAEPVPGPAGCPAFSAQEQELGLFRGDLDRVRLDEFLLPALGTVVDPQ